MGQANLVIAIPKVIWLPCSSLASRTSRRFVTSWVQTGRTQCQNADLQTEGSQSYNHPCFWAWILFAGRSGSLGLGTSISSESNTRNRFTKALSQRYKFDCRKRKTGEPNTNFLPLWVGNSCSRVGANLRHTDQTKQTWGPRISINEGSG